MSDGDPLPVRAWSHFGRMSLLQETALEPPLSPGAAGMSQCAYIEVLATQRDNVTLTRCFVFAEITYIRERKVAQQARRARQDKVPVLLAKRRAITT